MKFCNTCGTYKPLDRFPSKKVSKDGKGSNCKDCMNAWQKRRRGPKKTIRPSGSLKALVSGPLPAKGEISIYVLWEQGEIFYVGSTKKPLNRIQGHGRKFGDGINMHIVKNVPVDQALYWECKMIVDYIEAGCTLVNQIAPSVSTRTGGKEKLPPDLVESQT